MKLDNYLQQTNSNEVQFWINHNLKNYLDKNEERIGEIEHIIDYLNSDKAPKRLKKMSYDVAKRLSKEWVERMNKKAQGVVETEEDTEVVIDFGDGMKLVKLVGKAAFEREGKNMAHCVSSYYGRENTTIYSLRDIKNDPHCTIEVIGDNENVQQIKGKGNGSIHPKYINYVIKTLEHFGTSVRGSELSNLGYSELPEDYMKLLETEFTGHKWLTYGGKRYFYNKSKLVRKKGE